MPQARNKGIYDDLGNRLSQHLRNNYRRLKIKKVGSRNKGINKRSSDLDYHLCIEGISKDQLYKDIVKLFYEKLPTYNGEKIDYKVGESGNVVNALPENGGKISFALRCDDF